MALMAESVLLIFIGLTDLLVTLVFLQSRAFVEGNPLMAYYLKLGTGPFIVVKMMLLFLPIFVAEWSRRYRPQFVRWMLRGAIAAYLGTYILLFFIINVVPLAKASDSGPMQNVVKIAEKLR
ncbi:MAG: hypothetical protein HYX78_02270 [Armatimonadetes bacterium]|nr:hypothetical protein [Armatimonadota bacterium]